MMQNEDLNDQRYMAPAVIAQRQHALEYVNQLHRQLLGALLIACTCAYVLYNIVIEQYIASCVCCPLENEKFSFNF